MVLGTLNTSIIVEDPNHTDVVLIPKKFGLVNITDFSLLASITYSIRLLLR